jgi:NAD(P)-dependent dehydrogenase (short-subunit alcohol dehydrogenase family)
MCYRCDVSDRDAVLSLANKVKDEVGDVCILVNNAGIMHCHPLLRHNPQEIRKTYDINVLAHFWVSLSGIYGSTFTPVRKVAKKRQLTWSCVCVRSSVRPPARPRGRIRPPSPPPGHVFVKFCIEVF